MTNPKIIFVNIDPAFSSKEEKLSQQVITNFRKEIIAGNLFIPFSQFMPKAITNIASQITNASPLIAYNGAVALDEMGRPLVSQFLETEKVLEICKEVEKHSTLTWNVYSGYNWLTQKVSPLVKERENLLHLTAFTASLDTLAKLKGVHKLEIMGPQSDLEKIKIPALTFKKEKTSSTLNLYAPEVDLDNTFKEVGNYYDIAENNWKVISSLAN